MRMFLFDVNMFLSAPVRKYGDGPRLLLRPDHKVREAFTAKAYVGAENGTFPLSLL